MVKANLEYASPVWDPYTEKDSSALDKIQNRAARWASRCYHRDTPTSEILESLSWPPLKQRRRQKRLSLFYKYHNSIVHINSKYKPIPAPPQRVTRNSNPNKYPITSHRTQYRKQSFFPQTLRDWNSLPVERVTVPTLESFEARVVALQ